MGGRKEFTNRQKFRYILCEARRLAHHSCSRASAHFLPALVRVRFPPHNRQGSSGPSAAVCQSGRYLPSWDPGAEVRAEHRVQTEVRGSPPTTFATSVPSQRGLALRTKWIFSYISFASLNVFTLAPGAFPIRSTLCRQKLVAQVQHPGRRGVEGAGA